MNSVAHQHPDCAKQRRERRVTSALLAPAQQPVSGPFPALRTIAGGVCEPSIRPISALGCRPACAGRSATNAAAPAPGVHLSQRPGERRAARGTEPALAKAIHAAIAEVIRRGEKLTHNLEADRNDPSAVGTSQFAEAVTQEMCA